MSVQLSVISALAHEIWHEYYPRILSASQIEYMLRTGYSLEALEAQRAAGVCFELVEDAGFLAYGPVGVGVFKLHKLYLRASARGQGLGQRALLHVEESCRRLGGTRLVLNVNKQNAAAIRAYERAGYVVEQSVVIEIGEGHVMDDFVYGKSI